MQAAERLGDLWWNNKENAISHKLDKLAPASITGELFGMLNHGAILTPGQRDQLAWRKRDLLKVEDKITFFTTWKITMEAQIAAAECTDRAKEAVQRLQQTIDGFRANIKNDLSSMKAASERVQNEVMQMQQKYLKAQEILTTPQFIQAIQNAERMAVALESIQKLTETKISVAVFGGGRTDGHPTV